jgi:hypothetical protein
MDSYVSPPIKLTSAQAAREFDRADLVFYGVDAGGASFAANVFIDPADTKPDLTPSRTAGYAGFFFILGHGGCFGDVGHCDVPHERDPFDIGPPHGLTPQTKLVDITDELKASSRDAIILTVLPTTRSAGGPLLIDALTFTGLRLLTYG